VGDEVVVGGVELESRRHGRVEAESESLHRCLGGRRRDGLLGLARCGG
jgi:hypothetical protein